MGQLERVLVTVLSINITRKPRPAEGRGPAPALAGTKGQPFTMSLRGVPATVDVCGTCSGKQNDLPLPRGLFQEVPSPFSHSAHLCQVRCRSGVGQGPLSAHPTPWNASSCEAHRRAVGTVKE